MPVRFCGALGADEEGLEEWVNYLLSDTYFGSPVGLVCTIIALLNGPLPTLVAAATEQLYVVQVEKSFL